MSIDAAINVKLTDLRQIARQANVDVLALVPSPNLIYLTGIQYLMMERPIIALIPVDGPVGCIIPSLELPGMQEHNVLDAQLFSYTDTEGYPVAFAQAAEAMRLAGKRIGVEGQKMRFFEGEAFTHVGAQVVSVDDDLSRFRLYKDAAAITDIRKAIAISEQALQDVLGEVRPGMTERQVESMLNEAMTRHGAHGLSFGSIILSGPNSALPHGVPSDRVIQQGDLLLFDYGARYGMYMADITRTVGVVSLSPELRKIYETVRAANAAGLQVARPGVTAQDVDRATRKIIVDAGYGDYFIHRTGHGLGIDGHEHPNIREGNEQVLEPGMVFTIEPGIYIAGLGGVRIEDNVVITANGCESLTTFDKQLRILGA